MGNVIATLFKRIFGKKQVRIVMVGLGYAGKTTILYRLKLGTVEQTVPTIGLNVETVEHNNISFTVWDIGWGGGKISHLWRRYFREIQDTTQVVIFVIDSSDRESCEEAKFELLRLLTYEELGEAVFLVFANKQDLPNAMTTAELTEKLGLNSVHSRLWYVQPTCATSGEGLYEGLEWLADQLNPQYT